MSNVNQSSSKFETSVHRWVAPSLTSSEKEKRTRICKGSLILMSSIGKVDDGEFGSLLYFSAPLYFFAY